jgi:hypothetical protein
MEPSTLLITHKEERAKTQSELVSANEYTFKLINAIL